MDIVVREATLRDIKILDSLQNKLAHYEKNFDPIVRRKGRLRYRTLKNLRELIKSKNALVLIAEIDGKAIGCGICEIEKSNGNFLIYKKRAWIKQMFVDEKYRREGVGEKIISRIISWLHKRKIYDIRLRIYANNPSVNAYKKYGFNDRYIFEMNYKPK